MKLNMPSCQRLLYSLERHWRTDDAVGSLELHSGGTARTMGVRAPYVVMLTMLMMAAR